MHIYHEYQESCQNVPSTLPTAVLNLARSLRDPSIISLPEGDEIGLANGLAGLVLLPLTLASVCPQQEKHAWLDVTRAYFKRIAQETQARPLTHPGLYHGSGGVALSLALLAQQDTRYQHVSQMLLNNLAKQIMTWDWHTTPFLPGQENFEVAGGAAGILRVLLMKSHETEVQPALAQLVSYLIWVSERQDRWCHHPERLGKVAKAHYPQGYIDLGLAHGLAGPLAALSLVARTGYIVPGLLEAIERWANWLIAQQLTTDWGIDWPSVIPLGKCARDCPPTRSAWCYGAPGIARALWLAGHALSDDSLCAVAREALASSLRRVKKNIDEPHLCHGIAGLLLICLRFAHDDTAACVPWLEDSITVLTIELQRRWEATFTQTSTVKPGMPAGRSAGFLTGATGGALTILAVITHREPIWDQILLLS